MALSTIKHLNKNTNDESFQESDYSDKCDICGSDFQTPKSLKCLHNFCLKCLDEKSNAGENSVTCPICDETTSLPGKGVDGLNTNYMLIAKQQRKSLEEKLKDKDTLIPCTYCDDNSESKAVAWCIECQDYLCEMALKYHKIQRKTKLHETISLDKLQPNLVPTNQVQKERMCPKHKDEKLKFYCETCEVPFCRDCEVIDHPRGESHAQVYLEDAVKKRSDEIQKEAEECKRVARDVDDTIAQDERVEAALQKAVEQTLNDYDEAAKEAQTTFSDNQKQHRDKFAADLTQFDERRSKEIDSHKQELKNVRSRISSALSVANMLAVTGTQYDVADMYKDVVSALRDLRDFKPVAEHFSNVSFKRNEECIPVVESLPAPGSLKVGIWELKREFGKDGNGKLSGARGLAFARTGNIVVSDHKARNIKVFNEHGDHQMNPNPGNFSYPFDVTFTRDGSCYVTDASQNVKKFNDAMNYQTNYQYGSSAIYGIAATNAGSLVACSHDQNLIYIYNNTGGQTGSISVMQPWFISVTSKDNFAFTSQNQKSVQIVNANGQLMQIIGPPPNMDGNAWVPYGVCCSPDDEIFVANRGTAAMGIYRFKLSGEFIECITNELNTPWGLAISGDGENIAVVDEDGASVKIFGLK